MIKKVMIFFFAIAAFINNANADSKSLVLECQGQNFCDPIITISNFLKTGHVFSSKDVLISVEEQGSVVFETTFEDYLNNYWLPYGGYSE